MRYVVDTSLINKLVDGAVMADELPSDGAFVATHIQRDELEHTSSKTRRDALLSKFSEIIEDKLPTETLVFGTSRLDQGKFECADSYRVIKEKLDSLNNGKSNNVNDALIAEVALKNGYVLLTADYHMDKVAVAQGISVRYWKC